MSGVGNCARCGGNHPDIEFIDLTNPIPSDFPGGPIWTSWAPCPTNGEPILSATIPDGAREFINRLWDMPEVGDDVGSMLAADRSLLELLVFRIKMTQERRAELLEAGVDARQLATAITQAEGGLLWLEAAVSDVRVRCTCGPEEACGDCPPSELLIARRAWLHLKAGSDVPPEEQLLDWYRKGVQDGRINPDSYIKG